MVRRTWRRGIVLTAAFVVLTALAGAAQADQLIIDAYVDVNIYYGTVQLYSPTDVLLSSFDAMTVETSCGCLSPPPNDPLGVWVPLMAQIVAPEMAIPISGNPPIPAFVTDNISSFEDANGFGADIGPFVAAPTPNTSPSPSAQQLYQILTTQPAPFVVTSDTGFVELGGSLEYVYEFGPIGGLPDSQPGTDLSVEGAVQVWTFERDFQLQETAAPEPGGFVLAALAIGLMLWKSSESRA